MGHEPIPCPDCGGRGCQVFYTWDLGAKVVRTTDPSFASSTGRVPPRETSVGPCDLCNGERTVRADRVEAIRLGRRLAADRAWRGLSPRDEADRLGISVSELNDREWGRR